jgi:hypothetical protein
MTNINLHTFVLSLWIALTVTAPQVATAQTIRTIVQNLTSFLRLFIPILTAAALLVFIAGLAEYTFQAGDESAVETGKNRMIWGVVGLFLVSTIWAVVQLIGGSIGIM